jgi:hypothetical protein
VEHFGIDAMPFDIITVEHRATANDELHAGAVQSTASERTLARYHDECCTASTNECWPARRAAFPTIEEIRYASELRLQLRDRYLRRPEPTIGPWCVGVD